MSADPYYIDPSIRTPEPEPEPEAPDAAALQSQINELNRKLEHSDKMRETAESQSEFWYNAANRNVAQSDPQQPAVPPSYSAPQLDDDRYNAILSDRSEFAKYVDELAEYKARTISREEASIIADQKAEAIRTHQN